MVALASSLNKNQSGQPILSTDNGKRKRRTKNSKGKIQTDGRTGLLWQVNLQQHCVVDIVQGSLCLCKRFRKDFIIFLDGLDVIIGIPIVNDGRISTIHCIFSLFGQQFFHAGQLFQPIGQLRQIDLHLVNGHLKFRNDCGCVEYI